MKQSDILRAESVGCCLDRKRLTCRTEDLAQRRCEISLSPLLLHLQSNRTEVNNCHCNTLPPPNGDRHTITTATDNNNKNNNKNNNTDFQSGWSGLRWKCLTMAPGPQRHDNKAGEGGNGRGYRKYSHFIPGSNMRGKHDKQFTLKFNSAC